MRAGKAAATPFLRESAPTIDTERTSIVLDTPATYAMSPMYVPGR